MRSNSTTWYVKVAGKQVPLGKDPRYKSVPKVKPKEPPAEILKKYHTLMQLQAQPEDRTLSFCIEQYLTSLGNCEPDTIYRARHFLGIFRDSAGDLKVSQIRVHHIDRALEGKDWKPNSVHAFITRIEACLNLCVRKGWIEKNPIKGMVEKPTPERREEIMAEDDRRRCIAEAPEPFKSALIFLAETGVRPIELRFARIEKCDLEKGILMVRNKTRKKTGKQERPVFLSTKIIELCRGLIDGRPEGWLFLNSKGTQWTQTAFEHRLQRLCRDLNITYGATLYSFRHGWGSTAINEKGINPALVAIQMGHTDLKQLMRTYLHADHKAMREALDQ